MQPYKAFTVRHNGLSNVISTEAFVHAAFNFASVINTDPHAMGAQSFKAIWDTGATNTAITANVAKACGLQPTGMVEVGTANGKKLSPTYLVSIFLPNKVVFPTLTVNEADLLGADILIGMDIIAQGDFAITNFSGKTVATFRYPSCECIDWVDPGAGKYPGTSKSAPCPCGSGKKYKRCCGA
jgi:hypothetical protein